MFATSRRINLLFSVALALMGVLVVWASARSAASTTGDFPVSPLTAPSLMAPTEASLHNPTFDNHDWYEFSARYQSAYPTGSWLPDDDGNVNDDKPDSSRQDWRLWFLDGKDIVETDPESFYAHSGEGVQIRPYGSGDQLAGLYQPIYNTVPCLTYEFQMYGQSRPEEGTPFVVLQVGIDRAGWHPDSKNDPAVHTFPDTMVWGASQAYKFTYGPLTATAEAFNSQITVFTYADAPGGRLHRILWDTGSLKDVTPETIFNPDDLPDSSGITSGPSAGTTADMAQISWETAGPAIDQVFYRLTSTPEPAPPTETLTHTVYLPMITSAAVWQATPLNKTANISHFTILTGLQPDSTYEYIVASRGVSSGQCVTWSKMGTFTTKEQP